MIEPPGITMIDEQEWRSAAEIEQSHPGWIVIWGCYSQLFWAFPRFQVPRGTIVSAPEQSQLLADMHRVEVEASARALVGPRPPDLPVRHEPGPYHDDPGRDGAGPHSS